MTPSVKRIIYFFIISNAAFLLVKAPAIYQYFMERKYTTVFLSKEKLHRGQPLSGSVVESKQILRSDDQQGYLHPSDLEGNSIEQYISKKVIPAQAFLKKEDISVRSENFVNQILRPNFRALYLRINPEQLSKGLTGGWRVDVSLTHPDRSTNISNSTYILRGVKVLDVGREGDKNRGGEGPYYIVLEVSPEDAEIILAGNRAGVLNFLAISQEEQTTVLAPKQHTVKIIRGVHAK